MRLVKFFLWSGFIALLAVSLPKTAWVFHSYETGSYPVNIFSIVIDLYWVTPLFVALCIDALILSLTYALSKERSKAGIGGMWFFTAALCALSYICNLLYNLGHAPTDGIFALWIVAHSVVFIVSGVPLFALCYTLILSRVDGNVETLEEKATRLENTKAIKKRINEAKAGRATNAIKSLLSSSAEIRNHARKAFESPLVAPDSANDSATENTATENIAASMAVDSTYPQPDPDISEQTQHTKDAATSESLPVIIKIEDMPFQVEESQSNGHTSDESLLADLMATM